ncbi:tryptophan synthase subunit alpha [Pigmentibacter sp. JX0631]|uniref:tryptophan synthase subunit alpha n=1 Tax=Pigmentibacter sp. JX0631 TaxID=2976982 RepID=UPI002468E165|nr:tryptophan synthase subunit alpha [Pigmentibacter sp. JX0631]WGL59604.1 tryptophan synthase subunit alpha [Pigmentibacter sp. JX0631]
MKIGIYHTLGDFGLKNSFLILKHLLNAKVDLLEIGLPFSDPLLDGTIIQDSHKRALNSMLSWSETCNTLSELKNYCNSEQQISIMTTTQLLYTEERRASFPKFSGLLFSDLNYNKKIPFLISTPRVWFLTPEIVLNEENLVPPENFSMIYLTRVHGITGNKNELNLSTEKAISKLKQKFNSDIWLGFGISHRDHILEAKEIGATGVIIGSAFVDYMNKTFSESKISESVIQSAIEKFLLLLNIS